MLAVTFGINTFPLDLRHSPTLSPFKTDRESTRSHQEETDTEKDRQTERAGVTSGRDTERGRQTERARVTLGRDRHREGQTDRESKGDIRKRQREGQTDTEKNRPTERARFTRTDRGTDRLREQG